MPDKVSLNALSLVFLGPSSSSSSMASLTPGSGMVSRVCCLLRSSADRAFSGFSWTLTGINRRRSSSECWRAERVRRILARTERGAPSPLRMESATRALREDERGGIRGPGRRREILPRAERVRNPASGEAVSSGSGAGGPGVVCPMGVVALVGDEAVR